MFVTIGFCGFGVIELPLLAEQTQYTPGGYFRQVLVVVVDKAGPVYKPLFVKFIEPSEPTLGHILCKEVFVNLSTWINSAVSLVGIAGKEVGRIPQLERTPVVGKNRKGDSGLVVDGWVSPVIVGYHVKKLIDRGNFGITSVFKHSLLNPERRPIIKRILLYAVDDSIVNKVVSVAVRGLHFIPHIGIMGFNPGAVLINKSFQWYQGAFIDKKGFVVWSWPRRARRVNIDRNLNWRIRI